MSFTLTITQERKNIKKLTNPGQSHGVLSPTYLTIMRIATLAGQSKVFDLDNIKGRGTVLKGKSQGILYTFAVVAVLGVSPKLKASIEKLVNRISLRFLFLL